MRVAENSFTLTSVLGLLVSVKILRPTGGLGFPIFLVRGRLAFTTLQVALKTPEATEQNGRKKSDRTGRITKGRKATDIENSPRK